MSLAQALWQENEDLARACLEHPFVQGLRDGTLARPVFQFYVGQDAFFLDAFARAYALALARCDDADGVRSFFALVGGALDELKLHAEYAARWEINLPAVVPGAATLAYTDFLLATASLGSVGRTCAAMTPCMRLYAFLGQSLAAHGPVEVTNPYAEWISTYASPDFEALAATLERLLDRYAVDDARTRATYRRAMMLERGFFDASLNAREEVQV